MTKLREQMKMELELKGYSPKTQDAYIRCVKNYSEYFNQSPDKLGTEEIKKYLHYLITDKRVSKSYVNTVYSGLKFFYSTTLKREWNESIPRVKTPKKLPVVLSISEVKAILDATNNLKHRTILTTIYAAGLRISEAVNLKVEDIDSNNMQIRVRQGKRMKDRYTILSQENVKLLKDYWKYYGSFKEWLFPGVPDDNPISSRSVQKVFKQAKNKAEIKKDATVHTLRHCFAIHLIESGVGTYHVQKLLGHSSPKTTNIYIHLTRQDIFSKYGEAYREKYKLPYHMLKVMSAIEFCRTSHLGGHVDECDECGHTRISYNSCRNRHCPKCQNLPKERWIDNRKRDLLPTQYFHVVFTLPGEINPLTLRNKEEIYSILFKACSETLTDLSQDKRYLGAKIGFISILHTWGQNLKDHPHIHCIVTGGGLSLNEDKWISSPKGFFISVKVLSRKFKGKFLYYLKQYYYSSKLKFPGDIKILSRRSHFQKLLNSMYKKEWVVYCKSPLKSPKYVLEYLGRYTHKVAISNSRIVKLEDDKVTFKWRDYKDNNKSKLMNLDALEFIRRFMLHVLPHRFVKIRHFGILSNRNRKTELKKCKELLKVFQNGSKTLSEPETWEELVLRLTGIDYRIYPCCDKGHMKYKRKTTPKCYSPPGLDCVA